LSFKKQTVNIQEKLVRLGKKGGIYIIIELDCFFLQSYVCVCKIFALGAIGAEETDM
jgi:hypothetical protein